MGEIEINLPERLEMQIAQLIEEEEYIDRQEAGGDLKSRGIRTLRTSGRREEEEEFEEFEDAMGGDDEYAC